MPNRTLQNGPSSKASSCTISVSARLSRAGGKFGIRFWTTLPYLREHNTVLTPRSRAPITPRAWTSSLISITLIIRLSISTTTKTSQGFKVWRLLQLEARCQPRQSFMAGRTVKDWTRLCRQQRVSTDLISCSSTSLITCLAFVRSSSGALTREMPSKAKSNSMQPSLGATHTHWLQYRRLTPWIKAYRQHKG